MYELSYDRVENDHFNPKKAINQMKKANDDLGL